MPTIKSIIIKINTVINNCEPNRLFYDTYTEWNKNVERVAFHKQFTRIGQWFEDMPLLISIAIKALYYIITWPVYICVQIIWGTFTGIFVPQKWRL